MGELVCANHPQAGMSAIISEQYKEPTTIIKENGRVVFEPHPMAEFMRNMTTQVVLAYTCGDPECGFTVTPDQLHRLKEL